MYFGIYFFAGVPFPLSMRKLLTGYRNQKQEETERDHTYRKFAFKDRILPNLVRQTPPDLTGWILNTKKNH